MIPFLPAGATQLLAAMQKRIRYPSQDGDYAYRYFIGCASAHVSEVVMAGAITPEELLDRHSAGPLLLSLLDAPDGAALRASLLKGTDRVKCSARTYLPWGPPMSPFVRRCPLCVEEDLDTVGTAFPRVLHQVGFVHHCPAHECPLQELCASCQEPILGARTPRCSKPTITRCSACGRKGGLPMPQRSSEGYVAAVSLTHSLLHGRVASMRPAYRARMMRCLWSQVEKDELLRRFVEWWQEPDLAGVSRRACASEKQLRAVAEGRWIPDVFAAAVTWTTFASALLGSEKEDPSVSASLSDDSVFLARLLKVGDSRGISEWTTRGLASGRSVHRLMCDGVPKHHINRLLEALCADDQAEILRLREAARAVRRENLDAKIQRRRARALGLAAQGLTRSQIRSAGGQWLQSNDSEWFEANIPRQRIQFTTKRIRLINPATVVRQQQTTAQTIQTWREQILRVLESMSPQRGETTSRFRWRVRRSLYDEHRVLYNAMLMRDREWLESLLPVPLRKEAPRDREEARAMLGAAVECGIEGKSALMQWHAALCRWCWQHDADHAKATFSHLQVQKARQSERDALEAIMRSGKVSMRSQLTASPGLYGRLRKHQPLYLDEMLPPQGTAWVRRNAKKHSLDTVG